MKHDEKQIDELLERGLREYSQVEPRGGLEERVMANLRTQPAPRPWWRMWVPALAAAAVLAMVAAVALRPAKQETQVGRAPETGPRLTASRTGPRANTGKQAQIAAPPKRPLAANRHKEELAPAGQQQGEGSRAQVAVQQPRQAVFPSPVPLTEQERLVLALLQQAPHEVEKVAKEQEGQRVRAAYYLETGTFPEDSGRREK